MKCCYTTKLVFGRFVHNCCLLSSFIQEPSSSSPVTQGVLTISDLKEVYAATFKAQDDWKNILLELGVSSATVERIGVSYSDTPDHCYHEGLSEWLEGGERSWGDLVKALLSPTVGHSDMATVIEKDFLRLPTKQSGNRVHSFLLFFTKLFSA